MSFISLDISTTADKLIAQAKLCGHVQQFRLESSQTKMMVKSLLISYNVICCFGIRSWISLTFIRRIRIAYDLF